MPRKTHLIRIAQYRVDNAPVIPWIGFPSHYAIQLVDRSGLVLDEVNFGAKRRGALHMDFSGKPWHNNRLTFSRRIVNRDALNHPAQRAFSEQLARGMFEAICVYALHIDEADCDYFFMGHHPLKRRTANSNSAAAGVAQILGLDVLSFQNGKDQTPVGVTKDIFRTLGVNLATPSHYRRLAFKEARKIRQLIKDTPPSECSSLESAFCGSKFWLYRARAGLRWRLIRLFDKVFGR